MTISEVETQAIQAYREFVGKGCCSNTWANYEAFEAGWMRSVLQRTLCEAKMLNVQIAVLQATVERLECDHAERYSVN